MATNEQGGFNSKSSYEGEPLLIEGRIGALEREQKEDKKRDEEYKRRQLRFNRLLVVFTLGLLLTALIADGISIFQSIQSRRSAVAATKSADASFVAADVAQKSLEASNTSSHGTLIEMQKQSKAMQDNTRTLEDATRKQLQPYVVLRRMDLAELIVPYKPTKIVNSFENAGNTPALNVQSLSTNQTIVDGSKPQFIFKIISGSIANIAPKGTYDMQLVVMPMTPTQVAQVYAGTRIVYELGQITYTDIFNQKRQTQYCMQLDPKTGEMFGCPDQGKSY